MGECGCTGRDQKFTFPGRGDSYYVLTLAAHCTNCDSPPGITIERIDPGTTWYKEYQEEVYTNGPLVFSQWHHSQGVAITTGKRKHEFVAAMRDHLVGVDSRVVGSGDGKIDMDGASVILEEMYEDSQSVPELVCFEEKV